MARIATLATLQTRRRQEHYEALAAEGDTELLFKRIDGNLYARSSSRSNRWHRMAYGVSNRTLIVACGCEWASYANANGNPKPCRHATNLRRHILNGLDVYRPTDLDEDVVPAAKHPLGASVIADVKQRASVARSTNHAGGDAA